MDLQQGLLCSITNELADFEGECKDFEKDETVKERPLEELEPLTTLEVAASLSGETISELKQHQDMVFAVVGGLFVSVISALIWAAITVSTEYQIGYMAIAVGFAVGMGVRFFGAGIEPVYGYLGGFLALLGCALGNLFSQVGFIAHYQQLSYWNTLMLMLADFEVIIDVFAESFSPMDLLFYGIAIAEGYKFAFRPIPEDIQTTKEFAPEHARLRLPLVIGCFVILSISAFSLSRGVSGPQVYYYETGEMQAQGEMVNGQEDNTWAYYYPSGQVQIQGDYKNGLEEGSWMFYYEDGSLMRAGDYQHGLFHGVWRNYTPEGQLTDSSIYELGRKTGASKSYYENGKLAKEGVFERDRESGLWNYYYDNGTLSASGEFDEGVRAGLWKYYYVDGTPNQEILHKDKELTILKEWNDKGKLIVDEGNGYVKYFYPNGQLAEEGQVENGKRAATWKSYFSNGQSKTVGKYVGDFFEVHEAWDDLGKPMIQNGQGDYIAYFEESEYVFEEGALSNGLRQGIWVSYFPASGIMQSEVEYADGLVHGSFTNYFGSGGFLSQGEFVKGEQHGDWTWYFENGGLQSTATFDHGKKVGVQVFYTENGDQAKTELYEDGEFVSETFL